MTKAVQLEELDDDELQNRLAAARRELLNLRFQAATGQLDNSSRLGQVRRDIARALTVLRHRDLAEAQVELEPLVLTPVRRRPLDDTGGVDESAEHEDAEAEEPEEPHEADVEGDEEPDEFVEDASVEGDVDAEQPETGGSGPEASGDLPDEIDEEQER
jgi:large subunit ribosomal protein L29